MEPPRRLRGLLLSCTAGNFFKSGLLGKVESALIQYTNQYFQKNTEKTISSHNLALKNHRFRQSTFGPALKNHRFLQSTFGPASWGLNLPREVPKPAKSTPKALKIWKSASKPCLDRDLGGNSMKNDHNGANKGHNFNNISPEIAGALGKWCAFQFGVHTWCCNAGCTFMLFEILGHGSQVFGFRSSVKIYLRVLVWSLGCKTWFGV